MGKQIELLEDHSHLAAHRIDCLLFVVQVNAVDDDPTFLITFQMVDAADERRLARPRWSAQNDFLACADRQVDRCSSEL